MISIKALVPQDIFETERLTLKTLTKADVNYIQELTNTKGWLRFIGDRGTATIEGTEKYIDGIEQNPACKFWKVSLNENNVPIGLVTLIKRDYLNDPDIGFAFLPQFCEKGFAFEASKAILDEVFKHPLILGICGITNKENTSSIKLLNKLGLTTHSTIAVEGETLEVYTLPVGC